MSAYVAINDRGLSGWILDEALAYDDHDDVELLPHVAGLTAVGVTYLAATGLAFIPHPLAKAASVGVLAVPDVLVYAVAYSMFD
jgi:hypothetical protein